MGVLKTNLDRLGGKVEITSAAGRGTTFRIKLPLTLDPAAQTQNQSATCALSSINGVTNRPSASCKAKHFPGRATRPDGWRNLA